MTPVHMLPGLLQRVAAIPELEATKEDAAQLLLATAFNFPAVLATAGKQQWPQLQPVHSALLQCRDAAVRRTLACSLHEVAALLGPDQAMTDLGPAVQVGLLSMLWHESMFWIGTIQGPEHAMSHWGHCISGTVRLTVLWE